MAVFISAFENTTPLGVGNWTSADVLTDRSAVVGVLVSSDNNLTLNFNWSNDGISTVLTEAESITGGTPAEHFRPIKAKYLNLELVNGGTNASLVVQGFFFDSESVMLAIRNLGTGTHIANLNKLGLRSLKSSDASITISNTADEIDLVSAGGGTTVVALNDNVQVTEAPAGQFNVGVGQDTANSLNLGWNTPLPASGTNAVNLGYGRSTGNDTIAIGAGTNGAGNTSVTSGVFIGSGAGYTGTQSNDSIAIGRDSAKGGTTGTDVITIGRGAGDTGTKSLGCITIGALANNKTCNQAVIAIGYGAGRPGSATAGVMDYGTIIGDGALGASGGNNITYNTIIGYRAHNGGTGNTKNTILGAEASSNQTKTLTDGNNVFIGYQSGNTITIGDEITAVGSQSAGGGFTRARGSTMLGYRAGYGATSATYELMLGHSCAPSNTSGRLSFGANMETPVTISTSSIEAPTNLIPMNWNGTNYRIPVLSSTATDIKLTNTPVMPLGEVAYQDHATPTTITVSASNTPYLINVATTLTTTSSSLGSAFFDSPSNGRLRFIGSTTQKFHVALSIDVVSAGGANKLWSFSIYKNGTFYGKSRYEIENPGTSEFTMASHIIVELATNDYVECYFENMTDTSDLVVHNLNIACMGSVMA